MAIEKCSFSVEEKIEGLYNENNRIFEEIKKIEEYCCNETFFEITDSYRMMNPTVAKNEHTTRFKIYTQDRKVQFDYETYTCFPPFVHTPSFFCGNQCLPIHRFSSLEKANTEIYEQTKKTKTHIKDDLQEKVLEELFKNLLEINVYIGKTYGNLIDTNESKKKQAEVIIKRIQKDFDELAFLTEFTSFEPAVRRRAPIQIKARGVIPLPSEQPTSDEEIENDQVIFPVKIYKKKE